MDLTPRPKGAPANPLPTNEQQRAPGGHAVAPAVAGRAPSKPSAASPQLAASLFCLWRFSLLINLLHLLLDFVVHTGLA